MVKRFREIRKEMAEQGIREYIGALIYMEIECFEEPLQEKNLNEDYMDELVYEGVNVWLKTDSITIEEISHALSIGLEDYISGEISIKESYDLFNYGLDKLWS